MLLLLFEYYNYLPYQTIEHLQKKKKKKITMKN
jgi:hypothetical protein